MEQYTFNDLCNDLTIGREIEFKFKKQEYSIINSVDGYWYFYSSGNQLVKLCEFEDKQTLVKKITTLEIDSISLKNIFNKLLYDCKSLIIF